MKTIVFQLEDLTCPSCIKKIESVLTKNEAVESARVLFNSSKVKVVVKNEETSAGKLAGLIEKVGYTVRSQKVSSLK